MNRIWHEYFGAGIVEPFDDFRSTNIPTNRELLDRLAGYFVENGFRLKALHRIILNSRTYQLSSQSPGVSREIKPFERLLFVRYEPRKLPAEVLLDSISQATGVPHAFRGYPKGTRAMDLYIPDAPDYFLVTFGFPRRDVMADRSKTPTLGQALHLINGDSAMKKIEARENVLSGLLSEGLSDADIIGRLYERAFSRLPSERESRGADGVCPVRARGGTHPPAAPSKASSGLFLIRRSFSSTIRLCGICSIPGITACSRRNFLKIGTLAFGGLNLPDLSGGRGRQERNLLHCPVPERRCQPARFLRSQARGARGYSG